MKYKKLRYNLLIVSIAVLVCFCFVKPFFATDFSQGLDSSINGDFNDEIFDDIIEDENIEDDKHFEKNKFLTTNPWNLVNYSIDMLYSGEGFYAEYMQSINITANIAGVKATATQNAKGSIQRSKSASLEQRYFYSEYKGIGADETRKEYEYFLVDSNAKTFQKGQTFVFDENELTYNLSKGNVENLSFDEGIKKSYVLYGNQFPIEISNKTVFSTIEKNNTNNVNYRFIEVKFDINQIPQNIIDVHSSTGQLVDVKHSEFKMIFCISVNTGKMQSLTVCENVNGLNPKYKTKVNNTSILTYKFLQVDEAQEIISPVELGI